MARAEDHARHPRRSHLTPAESGRELSLTASAGIVFGLRETADELLRDADIALYAAKAAGRNRHVPFEPWMRGTLENPISAETSPAQTQPSGR